MSYGRPPKNRVFAKPCECGCGGITNGRFLSGHNIRLLSKEEQTRRGSFNKEKDWSFRKAKSSTYLKKNGRHVHRVEAEKKIGRALLPKEVIHHKNENKHDNRWENLEILPNQSTHCKEHGFGKD